MTAISRIEVRGVTRTYGSTVALRGVTTVFEAGPLWFIQGPNGAGKSTLLGILGTSIPATSGTVDYLPLRGDLAAIRSSMGWVAHDCRAYRDLTVRENVTFTARLYGVASPQGWDRVADRVDLAGFADQPVSTLSRGQRQRVALARALVHEPTVLLLDEPATGLDAASTSALERVLVEERDRGALVIVVSHEGGIAARLGGRTLHLDRGRVVNV